MSDIHHPICNEVLYMHLVKTPPSIVARVTPIAEAIGLAVLADVCMDAFVNRLLRFVDRALEKDTQAA
jgi:chorismate synthase